MVQQIGLRNPPSRFDSYTLVAERRVMQIVFSPASDNVVDDVKITELVYRS